jgi:hypothetical protein
MDIVNIVKIVKIVKIIDLKMAAIKTKTIKIPGKLKKE